MKLILSAILAVVMFWPPGSQGISHVGGGGKILRNTETGFEGTLNAKFVQLQQLTEDTIYVRIQDTGIFSGGFLGLPSALFISDLHVNLPEFSQFTKDQWILWSKEKGWKAVSSNNCILQFTKTQENTVSWILSWGPGRGLVLRGESSAELTYIVNAFIQSIQIFPGACQWE